MITRIELKNFMSHAQTVIEPAAGLTVLVGPNNVGKSAIVAALQILSHNEKSDYVIRHGEKECSITVETDDGHTIQWRRKRSPSYVIDGQQFDRLGKGGVPDELKTALRLPNFGDSNDSDFDIHFGMQKSPIFLLDSSAANAAKFFASSSDVIRLISMQKKHKEKLSDAKKEKGRLETESAGLTVQLEHLAPVVEIDDRLEQLEESFEQLVQLASQIEAAVDLEQELATQAKVLSTWQAKAGAIAPLTSPPEMQPTAALQQLITDLQQANETQQVAERIATVLKPLGNPPALYDVLSLAQVAEKLLALGQEIEVGAKQTGLLEQLTVPPQLLDTQVPQRLIGELRSTIQEIEEAERRHTVLRQVASPPQIQEDARLPELIQALAKAMADQRFWEQKQATYAKLHQSPEPIETATGELLLSQLVQATKQIEICQAAEQAAREALAAVEQELRTQAEGEVCPVCGEPFVPDRLLASSASGGSSTAKSSRGGHAHD